MTMTKFKVGDKVRVVRSPDKDCAESWIKWDKIGGVNLGDVGVIANVNREDASVVDFANCRRHIMSHEQLELAPEFKVGDRVRATETGVFYNRGDIGEVTGVWSDCYYIKFDRPPAFRGGEWHVPFRHVEAAPKAKAERKFKVGDRVARNGVQSDLGTIIAQSAPNCANYNAVKWDDGLGSSPTWQDWELELAQAPRAPAIVALIVNGQPKPSSEPFVHTTIEAATKEAERLAGKQPGQKFGVFQLVTARIGTVSVVEA